MGPRAASGGIQAGDVAHFPRKVWDGVVAREKSCRFPSIVSSLDPSPRPERTRTFLPGPATRPRLPLPSYPATFRSPSCSRFSKNDAQFGGSPARPRLRQRRGPALRPMSTQEDPTGRGW